jgi:superfamily II DNA or RNA helicase
MLKLRQIDAHWCKVESPEHYQYVYDLLSFEDMTRNPFTGYPEKITKSMMDKRGNKFPCGLIPMVMDKADEDGVDTELVQVKVDIKPKLKVKFDGIKLEDYQEKCIQLAGKKNKGFYRGLIVAPTGGGKSLMASSLIAKFNIPCSVIVVINRTIFNQMIEEMEKRFPFLDVGAVGDDRCDFGHITVALYQSLSRLDLTKLNQMVKMVVVDEAHRMNNSVETILKQLTNSHIRFGLTATEHDRDEEFKKWASTVGNIGPMIHEVTDEEADSRVVPCHVYMTKYYCHDPIGTSYRSVFDIDILRSDVRTKKLLRAAKIFIDRGFNCLFLLHEIGQAEHVQEIALELGMSPYVAHSKNDKKYNDALKERLNNRQINFVIATQVFGTGTNIPNIDVVVLGSMRKSLIEVLQNIGRGRRRTKDKQYLIVIDSYDKLRNNLDKRKTFFDKFEGYSKRRIKLYEKKGWYKGNLSGLNLSKIRMVRKDKVKRLKLNKG